MKKIAAAVALVLGARILMAAVTGFLADDAFITFRYARNIAAGAGFVYNEGERVMGTSSPLFALLLAACAQIGGAGGIPVVALGLGFAAEAASFVVLRSLLLPLEPAARWTGLALFTLFPKYVFIASLGMETPLVVLGMLVSLALVLRGDGARALAVMALLFLLRIDTTVWSALVLAGMARAGTLPRFRAWIMPCVVVAGWLVFSFLYFGSVLPHAIAAKSVSWNHLFPPFDPGRVLLGYFPGHGLRDAQTFLKWGAVLALLAPVFVALSRDPSRPTYLRLFPAFFLVYNLAFAAGRVIMTDWYYAPGYVTWFACAAMSVDRMVRVPALQSLKPLRSAAFMALGAGLFAACVLGAFRWRHDPGDWFRQGPARVAATIKASGHADGGVMIEPIGYVGWETGLTVHDIVGLVSPDVLTARRRHPGSDAWFMPYLREKRPDFLVLQPWELHRNRLFLGFGGPVFADSTDAVWFRSEYDPLGPTPDSAQLFIIYQRRPASGMAARDGLPL